ncbi:hypothetical protein IGJ02_001652 [Enterococcus sp. DIV0724b]|uniref:ETX/MTX2 family pore-forming toxin n=1 Tax=Enterococcus sp. DIV0724b TaxID=2774694 RepID=UPI003D300D57
MKKFIKLNSLVLLVGIGITAVTPSAVVFANETFVEGINENVTLNDVDFSAQIKNDCKDLGFTLSYNKTANKEIADYERLDDSQSSLLDPVSLIIDTFSIKLNDDMAIEEEEVAEAAHQSVLKNNTKQDQRLSSIAFDHIQSDSVTTQTTHNAGISINTSAEMKFPFVSGSISMDVRYDFGHSNSVVSSVEKRWSVPAQTLLVPAGHTYKLQWMLTFGQATGTTNASNKVSAHIPYALKEDIGDFARYPIGNAMVEQERLVNILGSSAYQWTERAMWKRVDDSSALRVMADSKFKAKIGTQLLLEVSDITDGKEVLIETIPMNVIPKVVQKQ